MLARVAGDDLPELREAERHLLAFLRQQKARPAP
jgi:hypothetical protein